MLKFKIYLTIPVLSYPNIDLHIKLYSEATINEKDFRRVLRAVCKISSVYGASLEDLATIFSRKDRLNAFFRILIDWFVANSSSNPYLIEFPINPIWNYNSKLFLVSWK